MTIVQSTMNNDAAQTPDSRSRCMSGARAERDR